MIDLGEKTDPISDSNVDYISPGHSISLLSPQKSNQIISKRRVVSLDLPSESTKFSSNNDENNKNNSPLKDSIIIGRSKRAMSNDQRNKMNPLSFEEINAKSMLHPLSSLRSCSEFGAALILDNDESTAVSKEKKRSTFSRFSRWVKKKFSSNNSSSSTPKTESNNKKSSPINNSFKYRNSQIISSTLPDRFSELSDSCYTSVPFQVQTPPNDHVSSTRRRSKARSASRNALSSLSMASWRDEDYSSANVTYEAQYFLDVLIGFNMKMRKLPMEIELKNLREPTVQRLDPNHFLDRSPMAHSISLHTFERIVAESPIENTRSNPLANFDLFSIETWEPAVRQVMSEAVEETRDYLTGPGDVLFYEAIRIQPFTSGAYLRGMLMAGFSNMFFHTYSLFFWPVIDSELSRGHEVVVSLLYGWLIIQVAFNLIQIPLRIHIHYRCFKSTRSIEVESSIRILRDIVHSDVWLINRGLGWLQNIITVIGLIFIELYTWCVTKSDPLKPLVIALSATATLSFIIRVVVAAIFSASMHDPQVISDARKRGLSRIDLDVLPTFVYTLREELTNKDCSICLGTFDMGEMLISLPCDNRHSFHAACIRQWLQRQNSCPLCQRIV
jgi:hypothetical protein